MRELSRKDPLKAIINSDAYEYHMGDRWMSLGGDKETLLANYPRVAST